MGERDEGGASVNGAGRNRQKPARIPERETDTDPASRWLLGSHLEGRAAPRSPGQPAYAGPSRTAARSHAEGSTLRGLLTCPGSSEPPLRLPPPPAGSVDALQTTCIFLCQTPPCKSPAGPGRWARSLLPSALLWLL